VRLDSRGWIGSEINIVPTTSSQFVSGLMLAAPFAPRPMTIHLVGQVISQPFLALTAELIRTFGGRVEFADRSISISNQHRYVGRAFSIEPDATAASYFLAAAAITGGSVTIDGLDRASPQGDLRFADCLAEMGCTVSSHSQAVSVSGLARRGVDVDMNDISDTVPTLAVVALFADSPTTIRNVAHVRHKESDRIGDLARELRKLGGGVDEHSDGLTIHPRPLRGATLDPHDDHRLAMSLALAGLRIPGVAISNPECVAKTYPAFFEDLAKITRPLK
jgi:3-phosphoshikimate 1-carboxyvinyltransferase